MDSIFGRKDQDWRSGNDDDEQEGSAAALADKQLYEDALDFSKPRETAFEKAHTKTRGFFGRHGGFGRKSTSRRNAADKDDRPRNHGFMKARRTDALSLLDAGQEETHGDVRRRLSEIPDFLDKNDLEFDFIEATRPPTRQPPSRSQSYNGAAGSPNLSDHQTGRGNSRKPVQRSFSLATHRSRTYSTNSSGSFSSNGFPQAASFAWSSNSGENSHNNLENSHPNIDEEFESLDANRERKKPRARRHSVAAPPATKPPPETPSMNLPPDLHWLAPPADPSPSTNRMDDLPRATTTDAAMMESTPNTTSSRRKRGPNGSPVNSDTGDDWATYSGASSDFSGSRRSCIFSPTETIQRPFDDTMEHSSDDESCTLIPSPDTSFEVEKETKTPLPNKTKHVFETMASIDDLRFLVNELRKEAKSQKRFGNCTWKVAPPVNSWPGQRRAAFMSWAKDQLGFSVRSAGMSISFVQISKDRGVRILETLEAALDEYQVPAAEELPPSPAESIFSAGTTIQRRCALFDDMNAMDFVQETKTDLTEDDLAARVSSLTVNESSFAQKHTRPTATLPLLESNQTQQSRFSLESLVSRKSRSSVDSQHHDINLHLMGVSPRGPSRRPPRLSTGTSLGKVAVNNGLPAIDTMAPHPTFMNCVATPMNTECRFWGSRPVGGRDWGASVPYSDELIAILLTRFQEDCEAANVRFTFETECDIVGDHSPLSKKDAERIERRRRNDFKKRKRLSLFATAIGGRASVLLVPNPRPTLLSVVPASPPTSTDHAMADITGNEKIMTNILSFFDQEELTTTLSLVCTTWFDWASRAHANLLVRSVTDTDNLDAEPPLERSWQRIHSTFPWACFLAEGGAKKVFKAFNADEQQVEAVSVMDIEEIDNTNIVANEVAVSALLSSLVRRGTCPNFVRLHGVFTCAHPPSESVWGCPDDAHPRGNDYDAATSVSHPPTPGSGCPGRYQYIRMELINEGDAEEYIKRQPETLLPFNIARSVLFQLAFAVYAAADKFSVKHYDIKMLNVFIQRRCDLENGLVLRYGIGSQVYALEMPPSQAVIAKLADFGTADMVAASTGQPVAISHFTTLENTPPDLLILGDEAKQGHEHDCFGMGLCMLHLFTGGFPYEEIMEKVVCPKNLKKRLKAIWEDENILEYSVVRSIIFDGVDQDESGETIGDVDETFYDTLYRFLVLFGLPEEPFQQKSNPRVWKAIFDSLTTVGQNHTKRNKKGGNAKSTDVAQYSRDSKRYSVKTGTNEYIARARKALLSVDGGLELLFALCHFDPTKRATAMQVLNSQFMADLREDPSSTPDYQDAHIQSFMSFYYGESSML